MNVTIPSGMSGAAKEVLWCLFLHGPTWDGDLPSKSGRNDLVEYKLADRGQGFQWVTRTGMEVCYRAWL